VILILNIEKDILIKNCIANLKITIVNTSYISDHTQRLFELVI